MKGDGEVGGRRWGGGWKEMGRWVEGDEGGWEEMVEGWVK